MKKIFYIAFISLFLASCIKDEPKNGECDILDAWVEGEGIEPYFYNTSDMRISNIPSGEQKIIFNVRSVSSLPRMAMKFNITQGATIEPANGSLQDFSDGPVIYTVTSEDGQWKRYYIVNFVNSTTQTKFDFENYRIDEKDNKYYMWYEMGADSVPNDKIWATGNPGFYFAKSNAASGDYPTIPDASGYEGSCARLVTRDTGSWGLLFSKPIAAGNLYFGEFDSNYALTKTLWTTKMGIPFVEEPVKITGYYKYQAGAQFTDKNGNVIAGRVDEPAIYSVLYRNQDASGESIILHGDDVKTSPYIASIAEVESLPQTDEWKPFEMTFTSRAAIDMEKLANRGYNLALVFSSSKTGDTFEGAVGSTLCIDKVEIHIKKD